MLRWPESADQSSRDPRPRALHRADATLLLGSGDRRLKEVIFVATLSGVRLRGRAHASERSTTAKPNETKELGSNRGSRYETKWLWNSSKNRATSCSQRFGCRQWICDLVVLSRSRHAQR